MKTFCNINTNAIISRVECERNVCENELNRLRYGLENLLKNDSYDRLEIPNKKRNDDDNEFRNLFNYTPPAVYTSRRKHGSRKEIADLEITKTPMGPTYKSLLYKILEAKLSECLSTHQRVNKTPSDSISIIPTFNPNPILPKRTPENSTLEVNDYEKSRLAVPKPSTSRSKTSKKRKSHSSKKKN